MSADTNVIDLGMTEEELFHPEDLVEVRVWKENSDAFEVSVLCKDISSVQEVRCALQAAEKAIRATLEKMK